MRSPIKLKGITTSSAYADGDCLSIVNLRKKNGALKPVSPRKIVRTLDYSFDVLYVHQLPDTTEHWLAVRNLTLFWIKNYGENSQEYYEICSLSSIPTITQIGNLLNVLDSSGLKHVIWYQNTYKLLSTDFDGAITSQNILPDVQFMVDEVVNENNARQIAAYFTDSTFKYDDYDNANEADNLNSRIEAAKGVIQKALSVEQSEGYLSGFFLACTAIELYDGSFILHSNPVLLNQVHDTGTRYEDLTINSIPYSFNGIKPAFYYQYGNLVPEIGNKIIRYYQTNRAYSVWDGAEQYEDTDKHPNLIAAYTYHGNTTLLAPNTDRQIWVATMRNKLKFKIGSAISSDYESIIKSVCVFITPQVQMYDNNTVERIVNLKYDQTNTGGTDIDKIIENFSGKIKETSTIIKELAELNFYKVHEIPFENIVPDGWVEIDLKGKLGDLLFQQDTLPIDNFTHHKFVPKAQNVYNARLHAIDYKTILSHGFPFVKFNNENGIGQFQHSETNLIDEGYIQVDLATEQGLSSVVRRIDLRDYDFNGLNPLVSYPDSRAKSLTIYRKFGSPHICQTASEMNVVPVNGLPDYENSFSVETVDYYNKLTVNVQDTPQDYFKLGDILSSINGTPITDKIYVIGITDINPGVKQIEFNVRIDLIIQYNDIFILSGYTDTKKISLTASLAVTIPVITNVKLTVITGGVLSDVNKICTLSANSTAIEIDYSADTYDQIINSVITGWETQNDNIDTYFTYGALESDKTTTVIESAEAQKRKFILTPSEVHNFAYCFDDTLKPVILPTADIETVYPVESNNELSYRNAMKVSELNNPIVYPAKNTYTIGTSRLRFTDTNAVRTSDGETGKFPLYVGSNEGIYAMNIGTEGIVYSNVTLISNEVPVSDIHCSTPYGVIFIGKKGIYVINGGQVKFISGPLEQPPLELSITTPSSNTVPNISGVKKWNYSFMDYLLTATHISYDPLQKEIIVSDPTSGHNWVYNIDSQEWYQQTEKFNLVVGGVYPEFLVVNGISLKDFRYPKTTTTGNVTTKDQASVSLITRPFNFDLTDFKTLTRAILRARLHNEKNLIFMLHRSNDGMNFDAVQGKTLPDGNRRDVDTGMIVSKARQFIYIIAGKMDEESEISIIDCEVEKTYKEKLR